MKLNPVRQIGYRIFRIIDGKKMSLYPSNYSIEYHIKTINRPVLKNSKIFVYHKCEDAFCEADKWERGGDDVEVWRVECYGSTLGQRRAEVWEFICNFNENTKNFSSFWANKRTVRSHAISQNRIFLCKSLKLIKKM